MKQLYKELVLRCKYDKLDIAVSDEVIVEAITTYEDLFKMSVSEIKEKFESLTSDELMFLKLNDQRIGVQRLFA